MTESKLCVNCKYQRYDYVTCCGHPNAQKKSDVDGRIYYDSCSYQRLADPDRNHCGPYAKWFEPKEDTPLQNLIGPFLSLLLVIFIVYCLKFI